MARRDTLWCPEGCGKKVRLLRTNPVKYKCGLCGLTFSCNRKDIDKTIPDEALNYYVEEDLNEAYNKLL